MGNSCGWEDRADHAKERRAVAGHPGSKQLGIGPELSGVLTLGRTCCKLKGGLLPHGRPSSKLTAERPPRWSSCAHPLELFLKPLLELCATFRHVRHCFLD